MSNRNNQARVFQEVLSIDAWQTASEQDHAVHSIHVDVSFFRAKLGADSDSPVRFSVALRRAEIVIVIPKTEPLVGLQSSVAREPPIHGKLITTASSAVVASAAVQGTAQANTMFGAVAQLKTKAELKADASKTAQISVESDIKDVAIRQSKDRNGNYRWEVKPVIGQELIGKIWDPVNHPLMNIRNKRPDSIVESVCRVEVRCRKEDMIISDIELKSHSLSNLRARFKENRLAAAESYIKNTLSQNDLYVVAFEEPLQDVVIGDVYVVPEQT